MAVNLGSAFMTVRAKFSDVEFRKQIRGIQRKMQNVGKTMAGIGGAITAAVGGAVMSYSKLGDEINKFQDRTGMSTKALSEWKYVLEQNDSSLSDLQVAVKKMADSMQEAQRGSKQYQEAFQQLGVSLDDLKGKQPEEVFERLMGALIDIEDPLKRTALGNDIFGRSFQQLLPTLALGRDGMAALKEEAARMGLIIGEDAANSATAFQDALNKLKKSLAPLVQAVAESLIPALMPMIKWITDAILAVGAWARENPKLTKTITVIVSSLGALSLAIGTLTYVIGGSLMKIINMGKWLLALNPTTLVVIAALAAVGIAIYALWKNWDTIVTKMKMVWEDFVRTVKEGAQTIADVAKNPVGAGVMGIRAQTGLVAGQAQASASAKKYFEKQENNNTTNNVNNQQTVVVEQGNFAAPNDMLRMSAAQGNLAGAAI